MRESIIIALVEEGLKILIEWVEEKLERPLTEEELEDVKNDLEYYNEDDFDNIWCISLGIPDET